MSLCVYVCVCYVCYVYVLISAGSCTLKVQGWKRAAGTWVCKNKGCSRQSLEIDTCPWHLELLDQDFLHLALLCHLSVGKQKHEQQYFWIRYGKQQLSRINVARSFIYF